MQIKLTTYNIHRCIGTDNVRDPKRIGDVLEEINADIIALQEVEYIQTIDELDFAGSDMGFQAVTGPTVTTRKSKYGNVLLSRFPIKRTEKINLSYPGQEERGAIDVEINCQGKRIRVIATHLGLSPVERREQAKKLLYRLEDPNRDMYPTILMGDINEWFLWGRPLRWIHNYFGHKDSPATYPSRFPIIPLDKIWCHPAELIGAIQPHRSGLSRVASDHLPLTATVTL